MRSTLRRPPRIAPTLAALIAAIACLAATARGPALSRFEFTERQMGTQARLVLYAATEPDAQRGARLAFARIGALDAVMSDYREDSELMALCRRAGEGPTVVSDDLFRVLEASQRLARESNGAFDVTAGPLTHLWRRARRRSELPDEEHLRTAVALTGSDKLILNAAAHTAELRVRGMLLDLGGIGKGFAADEAAAVLEREGIHDALVALGGDIRVVGAPPGKAGWTVEVAPSSGADGPREIILNAGTQGPGATSAVSTSGDDEQYVDIGGIRYSHIIDPRTGAALQGRRRATVMAPTATQSDSLATAVCVLGRERGAELVAQTPGASLAAYGEQR